MDSLVLLAICTEHISACTLESGMREKSGLMCLNGALARSLLTVADMGVSPSLQKVAVYGSTTRLMGEGSFLGRCE